MVIYQERHIWNQSDGHHLAVAKAAMSSAIMLSVSYEAWLRGRNVDASKKIFVVTEILVLDFEFFKGDLLKIALYYPVQNHVYLFWTMVVAYGLVL
jgi:hypothetical protein